METVTPKRRAMVPRELVLLDWNWLHETGELDGRESLASRIRLGAPRIGMSEDALEKALLRAGIREPAPAATLPPRRPRLHTECLECRKAVSQVGLLERDVLHAIRKSEDDPDNRWKRHTVDQLRAELADAVAWRDAHTDAHTETEVAA